MIRKDKIGLMYSMLLFMSLVYVMPAINVSTWYEGYWDGSIASVWWEDWYEKD